MSNMVNRLLDLVFAREQKCCICEMPSDGVLCSRCTPCIPYIDGISCIKCGKKLNEAYEPDLCPDCSNTVHYFDRAYSCFEYTGVGKELLHKLKYEGKTEAAAFIARQMYYRLGNEGLHIDAVVPVPIHENKLRIRGFNQSYLIAEALAQLLDKPVYDCITRVKETGNQYNLDRKSRILNIADAFSLKLMYNVSKYKQLLLVDDIYTTGSTADECSRVLKDGGAESVYVITAATGTNT